MGFEGLAYLRGSRFVSQRLRSSRAICTDSHSLWSLNSKRELMESMAALVVALPVWTTSPRRYVSCPLSSDPGAAPLVDLDKPAMEGNEVLAHLEAPIHEFRLQEDLGVPRVPRRREPPVT